MKNTNINIRVTEELKNKLELKAIETNTSATDLIRSALKDLVNNNSHIREVSEVGQNKEELDLLQTLGFTELIFWIYEKRLNPEKTESDELYIQFLELIEEINHHPLFGAKILREFNKVKLELQETLDAKAKFKIELKYDFGSEIENESENEFEFPILENRYGFNYQILADALYTLRYDDDNDRVLNIK